MTQEDLSGRAILLVEDDAVIAGDLTAIIELAGGRVIGPADSLGEGLQRLDNSGRVDCAVLDINLNSLMVFGLADALAARGVPFVFSSAESIGEIPERHKHRPFLRKPFTRENLLAALHAAMDESLDHAPPVPARDLVQKPADDSQMAPA